jgi:hypothetical protein
MSFTHAGLGEDCVPTVLRLCHLRSFQKRFIKVTARHSWRTVLYVWIRNGRPLVDRQYSAVFVTAHVCAEAERSICLVHLRMRLVMYVVLVALVRTTCAMLLFLLLYFLCSSVCIFLLFTYFIVIIILQNDFLLTTIHHSSNNLVLIIYYYLETK